MQETGEKKKKKQQKQTAGVVDELLGVEGHSERKRGRSPPAIGGRSTIHGGARRRNRRSEKSAGRSRGYEERSLDAEACVYIGFWEWARAG